MLQLFCLWLLKKFSFPDEIKIDTPDLYGQGLITASSNWGILRGLETFSQLLVPTEDLTGV